MTEETLSTGADRQEPNHQGPEVPDRVAHDETHLLKMADKADKKIILARCGYKVPFPKDGRLPDEFSAWSSDIDCAGCLGGVVSEVCTPG